MAKNPYDCGNFPGKFKIDYVGREAGHYVLNLEFDGHKGLDALMFENEITAWFTFNAFGGFYLGNDFETDPSLPRLSMKPTGSNRFLLVETFADLVQFEQNFQVDGISPAKLAA